MKIAVFGTGMVGTTIGSKLVSLGHEVMLGSRTADNDKAAAWIAEAGRGASQGTFADAAAFGELAFNCTSGAASVEVAKAAGAGLDGKILIDVSNPLDFSQGFPPRLSICNDDSLGEAIQRAVPRAKVVKALNTMTCTVMVDPASIPGDHEVFIGGDDADAKATVTGLLREQFGWKRIVDLGPLSSARGTEGFLLLWTRLYGALGNADFNVHLAGAKVGD